MPSTLRERRAPPPRPTLRYTDYARRARNRDGRPAPPWPVCGRRRRSAAQTPLRKESARPRGWRAGRNLRPGAHLYAYCSTARSAYCSRWKMIKQDDELDKLEEDIRKLKNKYDQFFTGIQKMPPVMERHALEVYIFELGKQKMRENARRFRYNQLLSRYNQFREMWGRKMREREEGPLDFRRRQAALSTPSEPPPPPPPPGRVTQQQSGSYVKLTAGSNGDALRNLFDQIETEHKK